MLQTWDCHTKHIDSANHLINNRLVRNDSSEREIVPTNSVPTILFCTISVWGASAVRHGPYCNNGIHSVAILRSTIPKTMFWKVLQTWDCHTKQIDTANHLIYCSLVRNDSFGRKSFLIKFVLIIVANDKPTTPRYKRGGLWEKQTQTKKHCPKNNVPDRASHMGLPHQTYWFC